MVSGDFGIIDTRFERLTEHYRDAIAGGELKPGERFPSARELGDLHGVGKTTAGRLHGALISAGLIEYRPGIGTFVAAPPDGKDQAPPALQAAAREVVEAFDSWGARTKPARLAGAVAELRDALGGISESPADAAGSRDR
jgi:DNA-binding transcriptional regulator YhcF (GntR family)